MKLKVSFKFKRAGDVCPSCCCCARFCVTAKKRGTDANILFVFKCDDGYGVRDVSGRHVVAVIVAVKKVAAIKKNGKIFEDFQPEQIIDV